MQVLIDGHLGCGACEASSMHVTVHLCLTEEQQSLLVASPSDAAKEELKALKLT